jgi:ribosomal protein L5
MDVIVTTTADRRRSARAAPLFGFPFPIEADEEAA